MSEAAFPLPGRRVLVTGGAGFVGSHFVEALLDGGAHVRVTVHDRAPLAQDARVETVTAELGDPAACERAADGMDAVIHTAGSVGSAGVAPQDTLLSIGAYVRLLANVLRAAWSRGVGHALVFGSSTGYPALERPVREEEMWDGPPHPAYLGYGWMRRYVEKLAEFVAGRSGMRITIVRPGAIYGPRDNFDPASSHVVAALLRRAVARESPFVVWGTGTEVRDILHVRDFVAGSLLALARARSCDAVNIASGEPTSTAELARLALAAAGHHAEIRFDPGRPVAIPYRVLDITKARCELGFSPRVPLADGLAETVRSIRA